MNLGLPPIYGGSDAAFYRIQVSDRKLERLASLKDTRRTGTFQWTDSLLMIPRCCCATSDGGNLRPRTRNPIP